MNKDIEKQTITNNDIMENIAKDIIREPQLKDIPEEKVKLILQRGYKILISASYFSGPLPSPEILQKYDAVINGSAERIIRMTEKQMEHRMSIENKIVEGEGKRINRGQLFAMVISVSFIIVTIYGLAKGVTASIILGILAAVTPLVTSFLNTAKKK
ncbi:MAG: DUF2335 domain-containing protein [Elusimicrobiota bacterium]